MRPKVLVNCAMSADGKIATRERQQVRISDDEDMKRVHRLRNECDAIIVGVGTVVADDPSLSVKEKYVENPRQPVRVILDPDGRTPDDAEVLDGKAPTIIATTNAGANFLNAETLVCGDDEIDLEKLLAYLYERGVRSVLVEGGGETIWKFFRNNLVDGFTVFVGSMIIGGRESPTPVDGGGFLRVALKDLELKSTTRTERGIILEYNVG